MPVCKQCGHNIRWALTRDRKRIALDMNLKVYDYREAMSGNVPPLAEFNRRAYVAHVDVCPKRIGKSDFEVAHMNLEEDLR